MQKFFNQSFGFRIEKVAILMPDNTNSDSPISKNEPIVNPKPYLKTYEVNTFYLKKNEVEKVVSPYIYEYDVFLNLCDGANDDDRAGIEVVRYLEKMKLPFTGANSSFYEPTRIEMKLAAKKSNILYPEYLITNNIFEIDNLKLKYPLIVKHHNSYSSIGLTEDSVVYDIESLKKQAKYMISKYNKILIEEFIEGREFTVLVVSIDKNNVFAFDAAEIIFPSGEYFKHFNLKWKNHNSMKYIKVDDNCLNEYLKQSSIKIYKNINGNGYARFDYRMNKNGDIFFLELNPNCSIYYPENDLSSADEILNFYENGHQFFTDAILNFALQRFI